MRMNPISKTALLIWIQVGLIAASGNEDAIRLLVRSDDMGGAHAVNVACIESVNNGIARSIEVLVPAPWFLEAVEMLNEHPEIDVGVHLDLTSEWDGLKWGPVLKDVPSLVDENGHFYARTRTMKDWPRYPGFVDSGWKIEEVERELRAQIEMALRLLPNVTHLSAHMGTAVSTPDLRALTERLAEEYELPIDLPGIKRAGRFGDKSDSLEEREKAMLELIENLDTGTWLLVEHPGLDTPEMRAIGHEGYEGVAFDRATVTQVFTSAKVRAAIERRGIELVSYHDVIVAGKKD